MTNINLARRDLVPEDQARHRPARFLERAFHSHALAAAARREEGPTTPAEAVGAAQRKYGDRVTELVLRGSVDPATTTVPDWAGSLSRDAVGDFFASLEPLGAGGRLLTACPHASLDGLARLLFPRRSGPTAPISGWIEELGPIPNVRFNLQAAALGPTHKCGCIAIATRELLESSAHGAMVLNTLMREGISLALDTKLFSADAETAAACAGLLWNVPPLAATAGGDNAAMLGDLDKIGAAIAPFTTGLVYIAHPTQAGFIERRRGWGISRDVSVWPTLGVPEGVIIGLDPAAMVSAFGPEPEIRSSKEAVIHEDTAPLAIATPGSPPTIAAPTPSLFQTDCVATLMILRTAWTWRAANCVAWISGATWGAAASSQQIQQDKAA